ncbi:MULTISPECIES: PilN family type IVB pilus formation outer membrane protein [Photorhabdus]|uniref:PilN family type IVB pilus formation outer membrane protein n=1 Tax=Photorhabdus kayaii TaxID=230088 RepID=A0ABX0B7Q9_9GAMM|nr:MULTISPECIES: PilN family type IVB pilus formation outer membrane protein [Photorhabdus]MCC8372897.1 PilN family type IVB pilus formation outer membrane protein [Photorhabdus bodei]MCC8462917.1 PilN family type IVB pilus formation outer membrane protein [Photorhabdus bodei]NDL13073.1 PilN family type IVB pilus formation outer membrane protein [Photorhabdus kayaii]NDL26801.1 PilN family type IVB pilus formation outer membrane protein [Photorhabdus kayaii]RAX08435.1 PilN family type IVB pilus
MSIQFLTFYRGLLLPCVAVGLSGCAAIAKVDQQADTEMAQATKVIQGLRDSAAAMSVHVHEHGYWVSTKEIPSKKESETVSCRLTLEEAEPITLGEFADKIKRICGVPVVISADARLAVYPGSISGEKGSEQGVVVVNSGTQPVSGEGEPEVLKIHVNWHGSLVGLLDSVVSSSGLHWKVHNGAVHIFKTETRVFQIYALPGTDALSSSVTATTSATFGSGVSEGDSGNSGSTQTLATSLTRSVMDEIQKTVSAMLTPGEGKLTLSMATASLAVTDSPEVLDRIKDYIDQQNKLLTTQVVLNVKILNLTFDRTDQYGVDWSLAYKSARIGLSNESRNSVSDDGGISTNIHILKGPFSDSALLIKALSAQGKVSIVTQPSVTTLNLQAVPMQVATQTGYVASISNTSTPQVGTSVGIEPATVTTGFNMLMLPYAMADKQILLQYNISLSDLKKLEKFGKEETGQVQLPTIDLRAFSQKVRLHSGETLVLSGFEQQSDTSDRSGLGSPDNQLLGGSRQGKRNHNVIVVMITPIVVD